MVKILVRRVVPLLVLFLVLAEVARASTLIPIPHRLDHVFDPVSKLLYVTTSTGTVERYDTVAGGFLQPWAVGGTLAGIDVTPNGQTVLVADRSFTLPNGNIHRINAGNGEITTLTYPLRDPGSQFHEVGSWDVVAMSNDKAFFTSDHQASGGTIPLRELNLSTNEITTRLHSVLGSLTGRVRERTWLFRSDDHSQALGLQSDISSGPVFSYSAATDSFQDGHLLGFYAGGPTSVYHDNGKGAVSRDGQRYAIQIGTTGEVWTFEGALMPEVAKLPGIDGGVIFDPRRDILYGIDSVHDQVVLIDTHNWLEIGRRNVDFDLQSTKAFDSGVVSFDGFSQVLYVSVEGGILAIQIPEPSTFVLAVSALVGFGTALRRRVQCCVVK